MAKIDISDFVFNIGFKKTDTYNFRGKEYDLVIKLKAYYEKDGITNEQLEAYEYYIENKSEIQAKVEDELSKSGYDSDDLTPVRLLISRGGEIAVIIQDNADWDGGIVVVVGSEYKVISQDEYL